MRRVRRHRFERLRHHIGDLVVPDLKVAAKSTMGVSAANDNLIIRSVGGWQRAGDCTGRWLFQTCDMKLRTHGSYQNAPSKRCYDGNRFPRHRLIGGIEPYHGSDGLPFVALDHSLHAPRAILKSPACSLDASLMANGKPPEWRSSSFDVRPISTSRPPGSVSRMLMSYRPPAL